MWNVVCIRCEKAKDLTKNWRWTERWEKGGRIAKRRNQNMRCGSNGIVSRNTHAHTHTHSTAYEQFLFSSLACIFEKVAADRAIVWNTIHAHISWASISADDIFHHSVYLRAYTGGLIGRQAHWVELMDRTISLSWIISIGIRCLHRFIRTITCMHLRRRSERRAWQNVNESIVPTVGVVSIRTHSIATIWQCGGSLTVWFFYKIVFGIYSFHTFLLRRSFVMHACKMDSGFHLLKISPIQCTKMMTQRMQPVAVVWAI